LPEHLKYLVCKLRLVCGGVFTVPVRVSLMQLCSGRRIFCLLSSKQSYCINMTIQI